MESELLRTVIWEFLRALSSKSETILRPLVEFYGLTPMQASVVFFVDGHDGPLTVGALGEKLCTSSGNTSNICKKIESLGFIARRRSLQDERVVLVEITPKGREMVETVQQQLDDIYTPLLGDIDAAEEAQALAFFRRLTDALSRYTGPAEKPPAAPPQA